MATTACRMARGPAVDLGRDHGDRIARFQVVANRIRVVRLIPQQAAGIDPRDQRQGAAAVVLLSAGHLEGDRQSQCINDQVHLAREATS